MRETIVYQNPHGKNHSLFVAFAPKNNPTIAIAVVVENGGYGSVAAGPIAGFMMEKYLNDTISTAGLAEVERVAKVNLIPAAIKNWYYKKDSIRLAKIALEALAAKTEASEENNKPVTEATLENNSTPIGDKNNEQKIKTQPSILLNENKKKRRVNGKP